MTMYRKNTGVTACFFLKLMNLLFTKTNLQAESSHFSNEASSITTILLDCNTPIVEAFYIFIRVTEVLQAEALQVD